MADFGTASHSFLEWLQRSGAELSPKIKLADLRHENAGRGVVAAEDIAQDEVLFRIPRSAILSVENSILSKEIPTATFNSLGPWLSLILIMLYEHFNGKLSNWAPYFAVLPNEFNTLIFWADDELDELQASAVLDKIGKESADTTFQEQLVPVIREFAEIFFAGDARAQQRAEEMRNAGNIELMHKMGSLIMAYAFDVEPVTSQKIVDEEGYTSEDEDEALPKGMVPLADMLNADANRNNARLFYEDTHLDMKTLKSIRAGEEIYNDYGPLPRSDLLRRYGYITDNYAQYDVVEIPMDLLTGFTNAMGIFDSERIAYLDEQEILDSGYDIVASHPFTLQESLSPELIIVIEVLLLSKDDFARLKSRGKLPKPERLTAQAAKILYKLVDERIAQYATSLEEDLKNALMTQGQDDAIPRNRRITMAKAVRIGEKQLLLQAKGALTEMVTRDEAMQKRTRAVDEEGDMEMSGTGKKQRA